MRPYSILTIGPLTTTHSSTLFTYAVDPANLDATLAELAPTLYIPLDTALCPAGGIELCFHQMKDFTSDGLKHSQRYLRQLSEADSYYRGAVLDNIDQEKIKEHLSRWPDIPKPPRSTPNKTEEDATPIDNLLAMVELPDNVQQSQKRVAGTDYYATLLERTTHLITSDPEFRRLQATWTGLHFLCRHLGDDRHLDVLPLQTTELADCMEAVEAQIQQQQPSFLLVDQHFSSSQAGIHLLDQLARIGETMLLPVLAWIDADFLQLESWQEIERLPYLPHHLENIRFAKYSNLQQSDQGCWLILGCNRFRLDHNGPWLSPIWGIAVELIEMARQSGWPVISNKGNKWRTSAQKTLTLEIDFSNNRLEQLVGCGVLPLAKSDQFLHPAGDTTVAVGVTLSHQMLLSLLIHFLLRCREEWEDRYPDSELSARLQDYFYAWAAERGAKDCGKLSIQSKKEGSGTILHVQWQPPGVLPFSHDLAFSFTW